MPKHPLRVGAIATAMAIAMGATIRLRMVLIASPVIINVVRWSMSRRA
jgi:hypothetical protein